MQTFIVNLVVNMLSISVTAWLVPGIHAPNSFAGLAIVALVFGIVNGIVRPIMTLLSLPFIVVTFGLFIFILNGLLLGLVAAVTPLTIDSFIWAMVGAVVISIVNMILNGFVGADEED